MYDGELVLLTSQMLESEPSFSFSGQRVVARGGRSISEVSTCRQRRASSWGVVPFVRLPACPSVHCQGSCQHYDDLSPSQADSRYRSTVSRRDYHHYSRVNPKIAQQGCPSKFSLIFSDPISRFLRIRRHRFQSDDSP